MAPLNPRRHRAGKDPIDDAIEMSSETMLLVLVRARGSVTSRYIWAQVDIESSPQRGFGIPKDEDEGAPCSSGSVRLIDFGFFVGKAFPDLSSKHEEIDEFYCSSEFWDYLA